MRRHEDSRHTENHAHLLDYIERRQRNIDWPDTLRNSRRVDELLWRGSPHATKLQRVGIAIFGLTFLSIGIFLLLIARDQHNLGLGIVVGLPFAALGVRVTTNAFKRRSGD